MVTALPNKLPWTEGVDYEVLPGQPVLGAGVRIRDETGESFQVWTDHPVSPLTPPALRWNAYDFKMRFTPTERKAIRAAALVNADVADFIDMLDTAAMTGTMIYADDGLLKACLDAFTVAGLLDSGRKDELLEFQY